MSPTPLPDAFDRLHSGPGCPVCGSERTPRLLDEAPDACRVYCEDCRSHWFVPPDRLPPPRPEPDR